MEDRVQLAQSKILGLPPVNSPAKHSIPSSEGPYVVVLNLIDRKPIEALMLLMKEISLCKPPGFPQRRNASASILGIECLTFVFERIQDLIEEDSVSRLPKPAVLCFKEMFSVLKNIRSLLEFCINGSKIASLMLVESSSITFYGFLKELSDLLEYFPWGVLGTSVSAVSSLQELMDLVKQGCDSTGIFIDEADLKLRDNIVSEIEELERDALLDRGRVEELFNRLGIRSFQARVNEIKMLEEEIRTRGKYMTKTTSLIEFVRYCKFVFFGDSWPGAETYDPNPAIDWVFPKSFKCPITNAVMRDPVVVVASGRTFDRANIQRWINTEKTTCPVTGETFSGTDLIPDKALREQIDKWSREHGIYLKPSQKATTKTTAAFIVEKLVTSVASSAATDRVVREIIDRTKSSIKLGAHIGQAGALPILFHLLHTDDDPDLQEDSILAVRQLVSTEPNKRVTMEVEGGLVAITHVLNCETATWAARVEAAFTLCQLSTVGTYRRQLTRVSELVSRLVRMAMEGPAWARGKALAGVLSLGSQEAKEEVVGRLVKACNQGKVEEVVKVVMVYPVPQLLRDMRLTWTKRKLRRKATLLLEICYTWACTWGQNVGPGFFDEEGDTGDEDKSIIHGPVRN